MEKKESKSNIDSFHCFLAIQKIKEWRKIFENPGIRESQKEEIRKKLADVLNTLYGVHKGSKESNEAVSKLYYSYLNEIKLIKNQYSDWLKITKDLSQTPVYKFVCDPMNKDIIEKLMGNREKGIEPMFPPDFYEDRFDFEKKEEKPFTTIDYIKMRRTKQNRFRDWKKRKDVDNDFELEPDEIKEAVYLIEYIIITSSNVIALELTTSNIGLSEERTKKKIKKMYQI